MNFKKIIWAVNAIINSLFFEHIGKMSYIGRITYINDKSKISIGDKVRIYPGMRAEILGRNAKIKIGENVSIGQNFHVVSYDDNLTIGNNVTISANVFISNCEHGYMEIGKHILEQPLLKKHTKIGDNCFIGYGAVILSGSILGKQCIIGANSVVRGVFPDYCVIVGNPARIVKKYNVEHQCWEKVGINL